MGIINTETDRPYNPVEERARDNAIVGLLEGILKSLNEISSALNNKNNDK
jgi:hypothetical protein